MFPSLKWTDFFPLLQSDREVRHAPIYHNEQNLFLIFHSHWVIRAHHSHAWPTPPTAPCLCCWPASFSAQVARNFCRSPSLGLKSANLAKQLRWEISQWIDPSWKRPNIETTVMKMHEPWWPLTSVFSCGLIYLFPGFIISLYSDFSLFGSTGPSSCWQEDACSRPASQKSMPLRQRSKWREARAARQ